MFNNYKVSSWDAVQQIRQKLEGTILNEFEMLIGEIEHELSDKEKLLSQVNNMQLQTQHRLDVEITNNFELHKQVTRLNELVDQQCVEIGFMNKSIKKMYCERDDIFSPKKLVTPSVNRTQQLALNKRRPLQDKENDNNGQMISCYSSIKKVKVQEQLIDENEFQQLFSKDILLQNQLEAALSREEQLYVIWKQMQDKSIVKMEEMQHQIQLLMCLCDEQQQQYANLQQQQEHMQLQHDQQLFKYRKAISIYIHNNNTKDISNLITMAKGMLETEDSNSNFEELIDILMEFCQNRDQLYKLQQSQQLQLYEQQQQSLEQVVTQLTNEVDIKQQKLMESDQQRQELLDLSQLMNEKITQQQDQLSELHQSNQQLAQLFSKSLNDLEILQEEMELMRSNKLLTSRTQDGSVSQKHFMINRYSTYFDNRYRDSLSCKNTSKHESKTFKFEMSSDYKRRVDQEMDDLNCLLDKVLNSGFEVKVLDFINNFQCKSGNFKISLLWQKLKELLLNTYFTLYESDCIADSINNFMVEMKHNQQPLETVSDIGVLFTHNRAQCNVESVCQLLHSMIDDMHRLKTSCIYESTKKHKQTESQQFVNRSEYSARFMKELTRVANTIITMGQQNDEQITCQIEQQLSLQKQLKNRNNKDLRNLQTSTCKILMELFKKWKADQLHMANILFSFSQGWQQFQSTRDDQLPQFYDKLCLQISDDVHTIEQSDLGRIICQELKQFLLMIYQQ